MGADADWAHLYGLRVELVEDFDQIRLRGHDGVNVLIDTSASGPAESNSTPRSTNSFFVALQMKDCSLRAGSLHGLRREPNVLLDTDEQLRPFVRPRR